MDNLDSHLENLDSTVPSVDAAQPILLWRLKLRKPRARGGQNSSPSRNFKDMTTSAEQFQAYRINCWTTELGSESFTFAMRIR
ncbi:hypothetical protein EVAR_94650_1 [Eumeta japonica]|uniref:Uncharacterized protein n=1 Tax=Eumeta variegata TaxID=151549 RepID=A0A4C1UUA8_EUMVA|nr:hypothetical protein EVAR_94650_1 [Eumeta japonica]